jgi:hypothetical protein
LLENSPAVRFLGDGAEQDEILIQEILKLRIFVELLTQQFTARSGIGVKVDKDQLVIAFGFGHRFVQRSFEPALGGSHGGEDKHERQNERFFHVHLSRDYSLSGQGCQSKLTLILEFAIFFGQGV